MAMRSGRSALEAAWITRPGFDPNRLIHFGPPGFPSYARLRYIRDPLEGGEQEADVIVPPDHPSEITLAWHAVGHLLRFTGTPDDLYFCVWDGWGAAVDFHAIWWMRQLWSSQAADTSY
ncbi:MAG TPA: hypothetical protein PLQ19_00065 [Aeromicrobium sp.]|nr:hypothetical protein [Aeromicrobium sp.]